MRPALEVLRSKVRSYMTETGVVERATGETLFDEETGQSTRVRVTVYEGPCLVRPQYRVSEEEAGGATVVVGRYDVMLPADAPVVRGDVLTVSDATFDPALVGVEFSLLDVPVDAWQVARYCTAKRFT